MTKQTSIVDALATEGDPDLLPGALDRYNAIQTRARGRSYTELEWSEVFKLITPEALSKLREQAASLQEQEGIAPPATLLRALRKHDTLQLLPRRKRRR